MPQAEAEIAESIADETVLTDDVQKTSSQETVAEPTPDVTSAGNENDPSRHA